MQAELKKAFNDEQDGDESAQQEADEGAAADERMPDHLHTQAIADVSVPGFNTGAMQLNPTGWSCRQQLLSEQYCSRNAWLHSCLIAADDIGHHVSCSCNTVNSILVTLLRLSPGALQSDLDLQCTQTQANFLSPLYCTACCCECKLRAAPAHNLTISNVPRLTRWVVQQLPSTSYRLTWMQLKIMSSPTAK